MATTFQDKYNALKGISNKIVIPLAIVMIILALCGWGGGVSFLVGNVLVLVAALINCIYIVGPGKLGLPRIFGRAVKRTLVSGPNLVFPFITDVHEIHANKVQATCKVEAIETTMVYSFAVELQYEYKISPENAWRLMDNILSNETGHTTETIVSFINMYTSEIVKDHYRGIDLDKFYANKVLQQAIESQVRIDFQQIVSDKFNETCHEDMFEIISVGYIGYDPDPEYEKAKKEANIAQQKKQTAITFAEGQKEVSRIKAEGEAAANKLIGEMEAHIIEQKGKGEGQAILAKGISQNTIAQAFGAILRDHPELKFYEAVKHLPHYLSLALGGSTSNNLDIAQFMAIIEERFGKKPEESKPEEPEQPVEDAEAEEVTPEP